MIDITKELNNYGNHAMRELIRSIVVKMYGESAIIDAVHSNKSGKMNDIVNKTVVHYVDVMMSMDFEEKSIDIEDFDKSIRNVSKFELEMAIREVMFNIANRKLLEEKITSNESYGYADHQIEPWRHNIGKIKKTTEQVKSILEEHANESTGWIEDAANAISDLNDPIASAIFSWSIVS